jgi:hypothetical protein
VLITFLRAAKITTEIRKYVCEVWQLRGQYPPSKYERGDFQMAIDQNISAQWRSWRSTHIL